MNMIQLQPDHPTSSSSSSSTASVTQPNSKGDDGCAISLASMITIQPQQQQDLRQTLQVSNFTRDENIISPSATIANTTSSMPSTFIYSLSSASNDLSCNLQMIYLTLQNTSEAAKRRRGLAQTLNGSDNRNNIESTNGQTYEDNPWKAAQLQSYSRDHDCIVVASIAKMSDQSNCSTTGTVVAQRPRCIICASTMQYIYHSAGGGLSLDLPFEIYYADFKGIFRRKMECHALPACQMKDFLCLTLLPHLRELVFFMLHRPVTQYGLEEFVFEGRKDEYSNQNQVTTLPREISGYFPRTMNEGTFDFGDFCVLGNFEGANISFCTVNEARNKCQILMRGDTNTQGCLHWFMFTVRVRRRQQQRQQQGGSSTNTISSSDDLGSVNNQSEQQMESQEPRTIQFSILNNKRNGHLYREGMQVAVLDSAKVSKGWHRGGESIYYYKSNVNHSFFQSANTTVYSKKARSGFQTMDFSYTFNVPNEGTGEQRVTFAYCYPYTLSDLVSFLEREEAKLISSGTVEQQMLDQNKRMLVIKTQRILYRKKTIGQSRLGLPVLLIRLTSAARLKARKRKRDVFIIARQHPGETPSSFVCEGLITYLLGESEGAKYLLDHFVFKIVPMVNPDGVVIGNSRCNVSGMDLNRKWDMPDPILHPEVFEVKKRMRKSQSKRGIYLFCDLHGHSMKKHAFFYGCNKANENTGTSTWAQSRLFPKILAVKNAHFSIEECRFRVTDDKKNTARVIAWGELKIFNSFTLETSFFGYDDSSNENRPTHFSIRNLKDLGRDLCESIVDFYLMSHTLRTEVRETGGNIRANRQDGGSAGSSSSSAPSSTQTSMKVSRVIGQVGQVFPMNGEGQGTMKNMNNMIRGATMSTSIATSSAAMMLMSTTTTSSGSNGGNSSMMMNSMMTAPLNNLRVKRKVSDETSTSISGAGNRSMTHHGAVRIAHNNNSNQRNSESEESEREALASMTKCTNIQKQKDWRDYFSKEELEKTFKRILRGDDPNDAEAISGSDSDAEADIFKGQDLLYARYAKQQQQQQSQQLSSKKQSSLAKTKHSKKNRSATLEMKSAGQLQLITPSAQNVASSSLQPPLLPPPQSAVAAAGTGSTQKSRWKPSPLIQSYKIQMEMKKQNLKKQSYPIAKIGQNFAASQQNQIPPPPPPPSAAAAGQIPQLSEIPQQQNLVNTLPIVATLAKNSVNGVYLKQQLNRQSNEKQQQQQQQQVSNSMMSSQNLYRMRVARSGISERPFSMTQQDDVTSQSLHTDFVDMQDRDGDDEEDDGDEEYDEEDDYEYGKNRNVYKSAHTMSEGVGWAPRNALSAYGLFDTKMMGSGTYNHQTTFVIPSNSQQQENSSNTVTMTPQKQQTNMNRMSSMSYASSSSNKRNERSMKDVLRRRSVLKSQLEQSEAIYYQTAQKAWCEEDVQSYCSPNQAQMQQQQSLLSGNSDVKDGQQNHISIGAVTTPTISQFSRTPLLQQSEADANSNNPRQTQKSPQLMRTSVSRVMQMTQQSALAQQQQLMQLQDQQERMLVIPLSSLTTNAENGGGVSASKNNSSSIQRSKLRKNSAGGVVESTSEGKEKRMSSQIAERKAKMMNGTLRYLNSPLSKLEIENLMNTTATGILGGAINLNSNTSNNLRQAVSTADVNVRAFEVSTANGNSSSGVYEMKKRRDRAKSTLLHGKSPLQQQYQQQQQLNAFEITPTSIDEERLLNFLAEPAQKNNLLVYNKPSKAISGSANGNSSLATSIMQQNQQQSLKKNRLQQKTSIG